MSPAIDTGVSTALDRILRTNVEEQIAGVQPGEQLEKRPIPLPAPTRLPARLLSFGGLLERVKRPPPEPPLPPTEEPPIEPPEEEPIEERQVPFIRKEDFVREYFQRMNWDVSLFDARKRTEALQFEPEKVFEHDNRLLEAGGVYGKAFGAKGELLSAGIKLAQLIPIAGTVLDWERMSPIERGISIAIDAAILLPPAIRPALRGIKAARPVVRVALKEEAGAFKIPGEPLKPEKVTPAPEVTRARPPARHEVPEFGEPGAIPEPVPPDIAKAGRRRVIEDRLRRGEPVPDRLLAEFPDLQTKVAGGFVAPSPKGSVEQALETGLKQAKKTGQNVYVFPTAEGMKLGKQPPPFGLQHYITKPDGSFEYIQPRLAIPKAEVPPIKPPIEPPIRPPLPPNIDPVAQHISFSGDKIPSPKLGIGGFFKKLFTKAFDEQYPVRDFVKQAERLGIKVNIEEDPYVALNLLKGFYGKANSFLTRGTSGRVFWETKAGKTVKTVWGKSFETIVKPIAEKGLDREFSTYLIARAAIGRQLAERGIKVPFKIAEARKTMIGLAAKHPEFKKAANELYQYQDSLLKYARESGLLDTKTLTLFRQLNKDYVPYFRVLEDLMGKGNLGKNIAKTKAAFKRIKGSEKAIVDPLESIVRNTYAVLHASDSNQIGIMMANLANKHPALKEMFTRIKIPIRPVAQVTPRELGLEGLTQSQVESITAIFRPSLFNTENNVASILIKGKRAMFKVDPDLYKALSSINQGDIGILMKILGYPAKMLRAGAVLSPDFALAKNPARDTMTAFVYSRFGFIPVYDTLRGLFSWLGKSESYQLAERAGILKSMLVSIDREYAGKSLREILRSKPPLEYIKHPMETLQIMSELTEMASRMGEARLALAKGKTPIQAAFAGRDITLDFGIQGAEVRHRALNNIIAFFNANMRAAEKLGRETIQHPGTVIPKAVAGITIPSVLLYLNNRNDPRWKEIPQWQKDLFWIVFTEKNIWRIPKPFELGLIFGSIPERMLEYIDNQDPKMLNELWGNMVEVATPGFLPTALLPLIENMTNYSFFLDRKIVPEGRENLPAELQYKLYTPEIVKKFGEWVNYSPAKIDNILQGYTAGLGNYAIQALDGILKNTGVLPDIPKPSPTLADLPVVKALIVRDPYGSSGETITKFYDLLEKTEGDERALKEWLRLNKEKKYTDYLKEHPEAMFNFDWDTGDTYSASARYLRRVASDLSEIRRKQYEVYEDPDMSPEDKKVKIDGMNRLLTQVSGLALANLKEMPDELRLDLMPETAVEPKPGQALLFEVADIAPSYLREYIESHQKEWAQRDLKQFRLSFRDMKETDQKLLERYEQATKDTDSTYRASFREDHPDIDAALLFWRGYKENHSDEAIDLLKQKADSLGIPYKAIPALHVEVKIPKPKKAKLLKLSKAGKGTRLKGGLLEKVKR